MVERSHAIFLVGPLTLDTIGLILISGVFLCVFIR